MINRRTLLLVTYEAILLKLKVGVFFCLIVLFLSMTIRLLSLLNARQLNHYTDLCSELLIKLFYLLSSTSWQPGSGSTRFSRTIFMVQKWMLCIFTQFCEQMQMKTRFFHLKTVKKCLKNGEKQRFFGGLTKFCEYFSILTCFDR